MANSIKKFNLISPDLYMYHSMFQGNYDSYVKTRAELEENQMKQYNREQEEIKHMKVSIESPLLL